MGIIAFVFAILITLVLLFDVVPYCLAALIMRRFPPGGPYVWQITKSFFTPKVRTATWNDIPNDDPS
jgi:hypothetical protein